MPIAPSQFLRLTTTDYRKIARLTERAEQHKDVQMLQELSAMEKLGYKLEIEAISTIQMHYLTSVYLTKKLYG